MNSTPHYMEMRQCLACTKPRIVLSSIQNDLVQCGVMSFYITMRGNGMWGKGKRGNVVKGITTPPDKTTG
jgi:hypothetical protein